MDYSTMSTGLGCWRKDFHRHEEKLAPAGDAIALRFGTAWHKIMEWHNLGKPNPIVVLDEMGWIDPPNDWRTREKLVRGYHKWCEVYRNTPWNVRLAEVPLQTTFDGWPYEGKSDILVETDAGEGTGIELWSGDAKTSSRLTTSWVTFYRVSNQFKLYFAAMREREPTLAGLFVDLYHCTKGVAKSKDEDEHYGNRFHRQFFRFDERSIEEAIKDFAAASRLRSFVKESGYWPKNTDHCNHYNTPCEFLDLCEEPDPEVQQILKAQYVPYTFNPLET
ncbi:MAG TPA: PD-(D/E)XK nuclease family protein [Candidatus Heimdallarchaeota archaeon]|nr:PD-(D/E)XK nuclease family protein [Candidatus Heimdallarchaeota archaeon]